MMDAMEIYKKLSRPPADALKAIGGGRLKGMTDIKPQWRIAAMTEQFGLCGTGWTYSIDKTWSEPGGSGDVMCFAIVSVRIKDEGGWSEPIQGIGGSQIIEKESAGLHTNDEGYKMAVTDALSVAFKMIGMAADIYMGNWDGTKYREPSTVPRVESMLSEVEHLKRIDNAKDVEELKLVYVAAWNDCPNSHDVVQQHYKASKERLGL